MSTPAPDDVEALVDAYFEAIRWKDEQRIKETYSALLAAFARLEGELDAANKHVEIVNQTTVEAGERIAALERENEELRFVGAGEAEDNLRLREQLSRYQWVPVSERLPTEDGVYAVAIDWPVVMPSTDSKDRVNMYKYWLGPLPERPLPAEKETSK